MRFLSLRIAILLSATILLAGCASFRNNEIADVGKLPDVSQFANKPSVYVDYHLFRAEPGSLSSEDKNSRSKVSSLITKCLNESNLFSKYSFIESDKAATDYALSVNIYNHGDRALAAASGFVSGFTFGVIPAAATDNYTIEIKLSDKAGKTISSISKKDSFTTWIGLWFIPVMSNTPEKAFNGTLENQMRAVLKELVESGALKYSSLEMRGRPNPV